MRLLFLVAIIGCLPLTAATFTVTNTNDSGAGSLRQAILDANGTVAADNIVFALTTPATIALSSQVTVSSTLIITGPGARELTITASGTGYRFATVNNSAELTLDGITFSGFDGGGNTGGVLITIAPSNVIALNCAFRNNNAQAAGVIQVNNKFYAEGCEFSGNTALNSAGVLSSSGTSVEMINCTMYDNSVNLTNGRGGVATIFAGDAYFQNCTIAKNSAALAGALFQLNTAVISIRNTILADNTGGGSPNCAGTIGSKEYNLIDNISGMTIVQEAGDIFGQAAQLLPLADNGGPTDTVALSPASPAIDAGNAQTLTVDQRGVQRPLNMQGVANVADGSDIGAFEMRPLILAAQTTLAFGTTAVGQNSAEQAIDIEASELLGPVTATPPQHFEVALAAAGPWSTTPIVMPVSASGTLVQTIYVRHSPTATGTHDDDFVISNPDANDALVLCTADASNPAPTITVSGTLAAFSSLGFAPSAEQDYTVSGSNLSVAISVVAPAEFEVSLTSGGGFGASVMTAAPTSGTVAPTQIYVRYNPAAGTGHSGDIEHDSAGALQELLPVSGVVIPPPVITFTGALTPFVAPAPGTPSPEQSYTVQGDSMIDAIVVTAPAEFEVSLVAGSGFGASVMTAPPATGGGTIAPTTIFVRYNPAAGTGHSGDLAHDSTSAMQQLLSVSGSVVPPTPVIVVTGTLNPFVTKRGTPSATQSYSVAGTNLTAAIAVAAPAGFEVSLTATGGFGPSVSTAAPVAGNVAMTTIHVRYNPGTGSSHGGDILHDSAGAATQTLVVSGAVGASGTGTGGPGGSTGCHATQTAAWQIALALLAFVLLLRRRRRALE